MEVDLTYDPADKPHAILAEMGQAVSRPGLTNVDLFPSHFSTDSPFVLTHEPALCGCSFRTPDHLVKQCPYSHFHFQQLADMRAERLWYDEQDRTCATSSVSFAHSVLPPLPSYCSPSHDTLPFDVIIPPSDCDLVKGQVVPTLPLGYNHLADSSVDPTKIDTIVLPLASGEAPLLDETFPPAQRRLSSSCEFEPTVVLSSYDSDVVVEFDASPLEGGISLLDNASSIVAHEPADVFNAPLILLLFWQGPFHSLAPCVDPTCFPSRLSVTYGAFFGGAALYGKFYTLEGGMHTGKLTFHNGIEEDLYPLYVPTLTRVIFYDETGCLGTRQYPDIPREAILQDFSRGWGYIPQYTCNLLHVPVAIQRAEERPGTTLICALLSRTDWSFARPLCLLNPDCRGDSADTCLHDFRAIWLHGFVISEMCLRWSLDVPRFLNIFILGLRSALFPIMTLLLPLKELTFSFQLLPFWVSLGPFTLPLHSSLHPARIPPFMRILIIFSLVPR